MKDSFNECNRRNGIRIPHQGSLCKLILQSTDNNQNSPSSVAIYSIALRDSQQLHFSTQDYQFLNKIFKVLDRNSIGYISKMDLEDFCNIRCPLDRFDDSITTRTTSTTTTFDKIWSLVIELQPLEQNESVDCTYFGLEAWMIFAKFISLAQYQDAGRKFTTKHDCTHSHAMKKENTQIEEEQVIMVDLPPFESEKPFSMESLLEYEAELYEQEQEQYCETQITVNCSHNRIGTGIRIPVPELDLDHSFILIHDYAHRSQVPEKQMTVKVSVFSPTSVPTSDIEFILRTRCHFGSSDIDGIVVKRSYADLEWLHQNLKSHRQLGGTLCGRILPPFPSRILTTSTSMDYEPDSKCLSSLPISFGSTAIVNSLPAKKTVMEAASKTGVGIFNLASKTAKSLLWKNPSISNADQKESESFHHSSFDSKQTTTVNLDCTSQSNNSSIRPLKKTFITLSQDIFLLKAKQLERYLNYLVENPAVSSSFPLRVILMASQSGLDAAKELIDDERKKADSGLATKNKTKNISSTKSEQYDSINAHQSVAFKKSLKKYLMRYPSDIKDIKWLRTAAQAALVLNVDGLLETAGYQSTSTKLQHASLPKLAPSRNVDTNHIHEDNMTSEEIRSPNIDIDHVYKNDSEFDDFDLLPDLLPLSQRSALCAKKNSKVSLSYTAGSAYSDMKSNKKVTTLGEIDIERDVRYLYDLLKKVDNSLDKCCAAVLEIGEARRSCAVSQMSILQSIDAWQGMRGQIIMQKCLLSAMASLKSSNYSKDESLGAFSQDLVWNASLASASMTSSKAVAGAIEAFRVAKKAKQTAESAMHQALGELSTDIYKTPDETEKQKETLVKLRMQSLHAAVVEHETAVAKRKAAISLANDVKYWNSHRKQSLLGACMSMTKTQLSAIQEDLKAWTQLRDGILSSPNDLFVQERIIFQDDVGHTSSDMDDIARRFEIAMDSKCLLDETSPPFNKDEHIRTEDYFDESHRAKDVESVNGSISNDFEKEIKECDFFEGYQDDSTLSNSAVCNKFGKKEQQHQQQHIEEEDSRFRDSDEMSESMQSLVEGLLSWGGNWETDEEFNTSQVRLPSLAVNSVLLD